MKEYISELMGGKMPTLEDYKNKRVPDPDEKSEEEYEDFGKLICSWGESYTWMYKINHKGKKVYPLEILLNNTIRLSGDQMITGWLQHLSNTTCRTGNDINNVINDVKNETINSFIKYRYSPGNFIFWPCQGYTINKARGFSLAIRDRIDLTLNSLSRWEDSKNGNYSGYVYLGKRFDNEKEYLSLFGFKFKNFCEKFKLKPFLDDNGNVIDLAHSKLSLDSDGNITGEIITVSNNSFNGDFPEDYELYLNNAIIVINKRNELLKYLLV